MPKIRAATDIGAKWARVTPGRAADYEAGVRSPVEDWASKAKAAEPAFEAGITDAISRKAYGKGITTAGTAKWQAKAIAVGIGRWPAGVRAAEDDYTKGFAPFRDVIERTTLPPRGAKGSPANIERVRVLAAALHMARVK